MTKRGLVRKVEETRGRPLKSYKILLNPTNNQLTIYNTELISTPQGADFLFSRQHFTAIKFGFSLGFHYFCNQISLISLK